MIQRLSDKRPFCKYCLGEGHSAFTCPRRAKSTMQTRSTLKNTTRLKPIGKQGKKTAAAVAAWKRSQPTNYKGEYTCHYCRKSVPYLMAEHMESKARRPDLRTNPDNLVATCSPCNANKQSKSHDEIAHVCDF